MIPGLALRKVVFGYHPATLFLDSALLDSAVFDSPGNQPDNLVSR